jgi:transcriptional regulator with XRE-family HTH domain
MSLTVDAAKDLGRGLRFMRHARNLTLRDVSRRAELSAQYVQNLERGERPNASEEAYMRLARGYDIPEAVVSDLLLKARVMSALEQRGLDRESQRWSPPCSGEGD